MNANAVALMMRYVAKQSLAIGLALASLPSVCVAQSAPAMASAQPAPPTVAKSAPVPTPASVTSPVPSPTPPAVPVPSAVPAPPPATVPSPTPSATPVASIASPSPYGYSYQPPVPPQSEPRIFEIDLTDRIVRPGLMQLRVVVDPTVVSVVVRSMGHEFAVPQLSSGIFGASNRVPSIPFFLKGRTFWVDFVASRQDGRQTVVSLPVVLN